MARFVKGVIGRVFGFFKKNVIGFSLGIIFSVSSFVVINAAMEPASRSTFCGNNCHEMHSALDSWKQSVHGGNATGLQAQCVDCHLPEKDKYFRHLITKAYHGCKHMYQHYAAKIFGFKNTPPSLDAGALDHANRMKNEICIRCHTSLLSKPSNETVRDAHMEALSSSGDSEQTRCVECHEDVGHKE